MEYEDTDAVFSGDNCEVTGVAVYTYDIDEFFDADIGGRDGIEVTCAELVKVKLDGAHLTRDQIELIVGKAALLRIESAVMEKLQEMLDVGDL